MRPKKQKKGWKHDAGDGAFDVFFECLGAIWKAFVLLGMSSLAGSNIIDQPALNILLLPGLPHPLPVILS